MAVCSFKPSNSQPSAHAFSLPYSILHIIESIGDRLTGFSGDTFSLVAPGLAVSVVNVNSDQFQKLTFGVSSPTQGQLPEVSTKDRKSSRHSITECVLKVFQNPASINFEFTLMIKFPITVKEGNVQFPVSQASEPRYPNCK